MSDTKERVRAALNKFAQKELDEIDKLQGVRKRKKNKAPEKEVQTEVLTWLRDNGFQVEIYEAKATFSHGVWRQQGMKAGTSDIMGVTPKGLALAIELKAKGKLSTFALEKNQRQIDFIVNRINAGAFACVVDSAERVKALYVEWDRLRETSISGASDFLMRVLPRRK